VSEAISSDSFHREIFIAVARKRTICVALNALFMISYYFSLSVRGMLATAREEQKAQKIYKKAGGEELEKNGNTPRASIMRHMVHFGYTSGCP